MLERELQTWFKGRVAEFASFISPSGEGSGSDAWCSVPTCLAFELKVASGGGKWFRMSQVEDHQREAMMRAGYGRGIGWCSVCGSVCGAEEVGENFGGETLGGLYHKISDMSVGAKPFDGFYMEAGCKAWYIVGFKVTEADTEAQGSVTMSYAPFKLKKGMWVAVGVESLFLERYMHSQRKAGRKARVGLGELLAEMVGGGVGVRYIGVVGKDADGKAPAGGGG